MRVEQGLARGVGGRAFKTAVISECASPSKKKTKTAEMNKQTSPHHCH